MPDHCGPGRGNEPPRLGKDGADPRPLVKGKGKEIGLEAPSSIIAGLESWVCRQPELGDRCHIVDVAGPKTGFSADTFRSEEHTSELQSIMRISSAGFCWNKRTTK